jgi:hypothetical protein
VVEVLFPKSPVFHVKQGTPPSPDVRRRDLMGVSRETGRGIRKIDLTPRTHATRIEFVLVLAKKA